MNTLILYTTKHGCTADCARALGDILPDRVTVLDLGEGEPDSLDDYDTVVIGAPVYMGTVAKAMREYCRRHGDTLAGKDLGLFLCCGQPKQADACFAANFPAVMRSAAKAAVPFGGRAEMDKLGLFSRIVLKAAGGPGAMQIDQAQIAAFAQVMAGRES